MLSWMVYALLVSLLLGLSTLAFEQSARFRRGSSRWLWAACIIASVAIVFVPGRLTEKSRQELQQDRVTSSITVALPQVTPEVPRLTSPIISRDQLPVSDYVYGLVEWSWILSSLAFALVVIGSSIHLLWRRRGWQHGQMAGASIMISNDCGPAVVGFLRPVIVVPHWLMQAPLEEQELVIAHERCHLDARDNQLLTAALCLLICMPWNPILWWQLRRLRLAIEIDCDARVLNLGHSLTRYSETLIAICERRSAYNAIMMSGYGSQSFLQQRIQTMVRKQARFARIWALSLACLGAGLAVCAAEITPPKEGVVDSVSNRDASLDPPAIKAGGKKDLQELRSQVLRIQAESVAERITQFFKESQNQVGWTTQLAAGAGSVDQRRFDALRLLRQASAITELSQLDSEGKELIKVSRLAMDVVGSGIDYSREAKFTETKTKKIYYGPVYMRRQSEPYMTLGMAGGRYDAGVSLIELNLKQIWDIVQRTKVSADGVIYVVDGDGRVIAHPDMDVAKSLPDVSSLPYVHEANTAPAPGLLRFGRDISGQEVVAVYAPVTGPRWTVFAVLPLAEWAAK
jgi:hypothetical protein